MRSFLLFSFVLLPFCLFSQTKIASIPVKVGDYYNTYIYTGSNGEICAYIGDRLQHRFYILDKTGKVLREKIYNIKKDKTKKLLGVSANSNAYAFYFISEFDIETPNIYSTITISSIDSNDLKKDNIPMFNYRGEVYINSYSEDNYFYVISKISDEKILKIYKYQGQTSTENEIPLDNYTFDILKRKNFKVFKSNQEYTFEDLVSPNKLYSISPDTLAFTLQNIVDYTPETELHIIDLKKKSIKTITIGNSEYSKENSYVHNNKLYIASTTPSSFQVAIYSLNGRLLKKMNYKDDNPIELVADVITTEGTSFKYERTNIDKTKRILKNLYAGDPFIGISRYNASSDILVMGCIQVVQSGGGGSYMPGPTIGGISQPGLWMHGGGCNTKVNTTWFNSFLNSRSLEIEKGIKQRPTNLKIKDYKDDLKELRIVSKPIIEFRFNDQTYLAYVSNVTKALEIVEFK